ncbi:hypothetical protein BT96DRAFT_985487 [Gymnopus androsaceus JB14]|uniref:Uncharacterized protein n=1 Tax=Gymnopus androsaceus JB14 TaxID=1447944 RepID=A0A6A4IHS5_9AGAR|nr:hypothetical protein BT96DRAFT_985487 [Gymnopus androsaceus JB14]
MLPKPVSYPAFRAKTAIRDRKVLDCLRSQARITNFGLLLLSLLTFTSLLYNLGQWITVSSSPPDSILSTLSRDSVITGFLNHLIIVPGHAIWNGASADSRLDETFWTLESYQRSSGRLEAFYQHIAQAQTFSVGIQWVGYLYFLDYSSPPSLTHFNRGQTRSGTTTTEAESYLRLAIQSNLIPSDFVRTTTENYALDSYQNLLFSIARFHEYTGVYPERITVVGYEMKRRRFTDLHRTAIRWPKHQFEYIGIDTRDAKENNIALEGEKLSGYTPYSKDLYGCHSELLRKRRARNHSLRFHPYHTYSPELTSLMEWCPADNTLYGGILPWS